SREKQLEEEQAVKAQNWKLPICYDDDDDEESSNSLNDNTISELPPCVAITPNEPVDSLSMGDEHLDTIPATKSDEFIKSSVENLVPNQVSPRVKMVVIEDLFEPFFDEEILPMEIDQHSFNAESDLIESMPNHDSSVIISSKIGSLFDEFAGELTHLKSFPSGIDETDCHPEKEIRFAKRLLYDNSSPRPPKEIVSDNSNADIESFSPSPIPINDSDSRMEEIDLSFTPDHPMPPGIEDDDYDSGRDIPILEELLDNYSLSLPASESYHFDIPSPYRPPAKPPDEDQFQEDPLEDPLEIPMADNRTMEELLQAPTEGYKDAVSTLAMIKSLKKPCIAGFIKPINSTPSTTPPLHHHSPPPTSSSMIVNPSTPKPTTTKPLYH
nr:hypothetical protein [Tanacetum cinerariifolium]